MMSPLRIPALVLTTCCLLVPPALCQEAKPTGRGVVTTEAKEAAEQAREAGEIAADGLMDGGKVLTAEELKARNTIHGARGHCRFDLTVDPVRLAPGQTGLLRLVMVFEGEAVMLAPANLQPIFTPDQGPLKLGSFTVRPASPGKVAPAYRGQPVYDNYAIVEVPVTMDSTARVGVKFPVNLAFQFDLHHGVRAQPIGTFTEHARVEIECGQAPDPAVAASGGRPAPVADVVERAAERGRSGGITPAARQPEAQRSRADAAAVGEVPAASRPPAGEPDEATEEAEPIRVGDDQHSMLLLFGGAAVGLLLVVLLFLRRR